MLYQEMRVNILRKISVRNSIQAVVLPLVLIAYVFLAVSLSRHTAYYSPYILAGHSRISFEKARVLSVDSEHVDKDSNRTGLLSGSQNITIRMLTGAYKGRQYPIVNTLNYDANYHLKAGQTVIVSVSTSGSDGTLTIDVSTPDRTSYLYAMAAVFVLLLCLMGGRRGYKSVIAIGFTLTSVIFIFVPLLYHGVSPTLAALALAAVTACVTLLLTGGVEWKSFVAILGTVGGVAVSAVVELIFSALTVTSGYTLGDTESLLAIASRSGLKVGPLLFAAVLISSLGAVMDVAISVASAIHEVYRNNPGSSRRALFACGMNVGRDMMGTMANTLILAFTGSALVTLIQIYTYNMLYYQVMNSNGIATEIIQALTGSIGVVLTVPMVSLIASALLPMIERRTAALHPSAPVPAADRLSE